MELLLADQNDLDIKLGGGILLAIFVTNRRNAMKRNWTELTVAFSISAEGLVRKKIARRGAVTRIVIL
jgi:hypothetical protein